jgi:hypothetical protein
MYCMALKVYTCQEAASGPKTFLNIFCTLLQQNEPSPPQPDSGPDSNINSPYCAAPATDPALTIFHILAFGF